MLTADQKEYKITLNVQGFKVIKILLQMAAIYYLSNGYVYWMVLELLMSVTTAIVLDKLLKREYPWLKTAASNGDRLRYFAYFSRYLWQLYVGSYRSFRINGFFIKERQCRCRKFSSRR